MKQDSEYWEILNRMRSAGEYLDFLFVPGLILDILKYMLDGIQAEIVCDPCAGVGRIIKEVQEITHAKNALAYEINIQRFSYGKEFAKSVQWECGNPIEKLNGLKTDLDLIVSIPPFGARSHQPLSLKTPTGETVFIRDFENQIIFTASKKLSSNGIGIFVVRPQFLILENSFLRQLISLGMGVEAVMELPAGMFAPYTNIPSFLVVIRNHPVDRMFVAEMSNDDATNSQIINNYRNGVEGGKLELGRFVNPLSFKGLSSLRANERIKDLEENFGIPAINLNEIATEINLGRFGVDFEFPRIENAIFIPLIGLSDVVESVDSLKIKPQNYAQVAIDKNKSYSRFVSQFLNSDLGRQLRESGKTGATIQKLNKSSIRNLKVFIPDLKKQKEILEIESQITVEQNILNSLLNEANEYQQELWNNLNYPVVVQKKITLMSKRVSNSIGQYAEESLEQWVETLPFPLASILRAWKATSNNDFKTKYEHLLHFFEANAEFLSTIYLSAFSTQETFFEEHAEKLKQVLSKGRLSYRRATFGTWKATFEYFSKRTRELLSPERGDLDYCTSIFTDLNFAKMLGNTELVRIISATNKMRNDWTGHGGVVGQDEAQQRSEQLVKELQKLREVMGNIWSDVQLVRALQCRPRRRIFENEIALLMGSNNEFLKENREMSKWMDVEMLYITNKHSDRALQLIPLVQIGSSPPSAKNACYFFNRIENDGLRFVSYHFPDKPELNSNEDISDSLRLLFDIQ